MCVCMQKRSYKGRRDTGTTEGVDCLLNESLFLPVN